MKKTFLILICTIVATGLHGAGIGKESIYFQTLKTNVNEAALHGALNLEPGVDVQPFDADLSILAGLTYSPNVQTFLGAADYSAMRTQLSLVPGTDVLAPDGDGSSLTGLTAAQVGLGNVDNTSDADKPVSTAGQAALDLKAPLANPTFTGLASASALAADQFIPNENPFGTIAGAGTLVLTTNFNLWGGTFSGATANITLPADPSHGIVIQGTNTYNSGPQIITFSSSLHWIGRNYNTATLTNNAATDGRFRIELIPVAGGWAYAKAEGDAFDPPANSLSATLLVTESEGIGSNDNDATVPSSAAVKDYVDNNAGSFAYDIDQRKDTTTDTALTISTNAIPSDTTEFWKVSTVAAGPTNSGVYNLNYRFHNVGGTLVIGSGSDTNVSVLESDSAMEHWASVSGTDVILHVKGMENEAMSWQTKVERIALTNNVAGGGGGYTPEAAGFDGTGDYLSLGSTLTGVSDSASFTISFWVDFTGGDGANQQIWWSAGNGFEVLRNASNQIQVRGETGGGTDNLDVSSTATQVASEGWCHWLIVANGSTVKFYKNGSVETPTPTLYSGTSIDFTSSNQHIAAGNSAADEVEGSLADLWFDDAANDVIGDYYSSGPVDLGADGSTPTGSAPVLYLSRAGSGNTWATDSSGNGNTYTVNGGPLTSPAGP